MKLTLAQFLLMVFLTTLVCAAPTNGQGILDRKVSLNAQNKEIKTILAEIEEQTSVIFTYRPRLINATKKISLKVTDARLADVLKKLFSPEIAFLAVDVEEEIILRPSVEYNPPGESSFSNVLLQISVSGSVSDASNEPLPGVNVVEKGTTNGTTTDADGKFFLNVEDENSVLIFSFIGYESQEVVVGSRTNFLINLEEGAMALQEVVVVGYGTQKRSDITGSVASLPKERLEMVPNLNVAQAIQGSIPGVLITQTGAGASPSQAVMIRGRNSIKASNEPLVIIDGIPGGLLDINPNDVQSIEILKDASAAAIYGSRGANGVILITTKLGAVGKPKISYSGYYSIQEFDNLPSIMDGGEFYRFKQIRDPSAITGFETNRYESGDWANWPDLALRKGSAHQHNVSVSGASENTGYYISAGFFDVDGIAVSDNYRRYTARINVDTKIADWLSIGTRTQLTHEDESGVAPSIGGVFFAHPLGEVYDADGNLTLFPVPYDPHIGNPLATTLYDDTDKSYQVFTNNYVDVSFPFLKGLKYRLNTGVRIGFGDIATYMGRDTKAGFDTRGQSRTNRTQDTKTLVENILSYNKEFGGHGISGTFLYSVERNRNTENRLTATAFPSDLLTLYAAGQAELIEPVYAYSENTVISQMMRVNYSFKSRYLLTLTARRDGYSGFGDKTKWGVFPSIATGWNIAEESFFAWKNIVSDLKLRASYGINGNQAVGAYETIARLSDENANMVSLGNSLPGFFPSKLAQDNLGWESSGTFNIGLDFGLFQNKIYGDLNIFKTNTTDLILDRTISHVHGITSITQNIGETENKGFEFSLNSTNISGDDLRWNTTANLSYIDNKIVSLYGEFDENGREIDDVANTWFIGHPININYHYKWAGIWQSDESDLANSYGQQPGFVKVEDLNDDGVINAEDRQIIGQQDPRFLWGLTNTISYKNFTLNIFVHGVHGVTKDNILKNDHALAEVRNNQTNKDWWTPENPNATWIRNHYDAQLQGGVNVPFYEDASFVRVKDISLSYDLPEIFLERLGVGQFRFYVTGRNLMTFTKWEGLDPELANQRSIPLQKEYVVGLNIGF